MQNGFYGGAVGIADVWQLFIAWDQIFRVTLLGLTFEAKRESSGTDSRWLVFVFSKWKCNLSDNLFFMGNPIDEGL